MNPPPALYGAMSRDRKPFTYTPGGLDLSEIKSERMAKRLMRNAMNQGVPEVQVQQVQSPPAASIVVPNFNCLPVQVFPTINLPANPKSLLRTRSNPEHPREATGQRISQKIEVPKPKAEACQNNSNHSSYQRPMSMCEQSANILPKIDYINNDVTVPFLPEISYEAEYFQTVPRNTSESNQTVDLQSKRDNKPLANHIQHTNSNATDNKTNITGNCQIIYQTDRVKEEQGQSANRKFSNECFSESIKTLDSSLECKRETDTIEDEVMDSSKSNYAVPDLNDSFIDLDFSVKPLSATNVNYSSEPTKSIHLKEESQPDDYQKEVKVVKKQVKKESKTEIQNGDHNGDASVEAELTVKIPSKKSAAKTETKVEVVKKQLPDGSIEEIKTTTTKTTIDGKTKISTKTETTIIPKEEEEEEEVEEEEEEEEENVKVHEVEESGTNEVEEKEVVTRTETVLKPNAVEEQKKDSVVTNEERSETQIQTTKKVTVVQQQEPEEEEEVEEEEEEEEEVVETKHDDTPSTKKDREEEEIEEEEEQMEDQIVEVKQEQTVNKVEVEENQDEEEEEEEEEEIIETTHDKETEVKKQVKSEVSSNEVENIEDNSKASKKEVEKETIETKEDEESEYTEEEYESEKEETSKPQAKSESVPAKTDSEEEKNEPKEPAVEEKKEEQASEEKKATIQTEKPSEPTIPLREPSIPLEKVEDVEIKPISLSGTPLNETITKSVTKNTEITTTERPTGPLSTQTEYNRIENIVTVNRTTKTLDHSYEQLTQQGVPTVKTYFAPSRERVSTSPQPSKPYQPVYTPTTNQTTERRHSLLLERLSTERQMPSDIYQNYQYNTQSYDQQKQWTQEPQAEVVTVSNVKPSKITNQQWYQNQENVIYNNVAPTTPASQTWNQPSFQPQPSPQPQYQPQPPAQPQPQSQYQPLFTENSTSTYQQNNYQSYTPKSTTWGPSNLSNIDPPSSSLSNQQNQYSYQNQNSTQSYQKSTQQYSSSYVPPPWEQDASYATEPSNQTHYQPPLSTAYTPNTNQGWNSPLPKSKFTKTPPTSYVPPAPNQSFVKPVNIVEPPKVPGKKTYYSEYERRYITVPESNYVPGETKFQPQPDPSPQYYYDNIEPTDTVEPQWRKELREFTEKTSQTQHSEQVSVKPPWEEDSKYSKAPSATYTPTPSWSQTLRPRSWRERSFESEYVESQETQKTSTLGRGRPLSSYGKSHIETIPERPRGVSVDRYNPNSYQSPIPAEHPPVQSHTLNVVPPAKSYHNPNVPAYHSSRASAEPREQPVVYQQPRQHWGESRASPIQSRSFKYLQWITGTEE